MAFFQVVAETRTTPAVIVPEMKALAPRHYVIVNKRPFATLAEVETAARQDTHYPDAEMYAVEAPTPQEASALFRQADPGAWPLVRGRL